MGSHLELVSLEPTRSLRKEYLTLTLNIIRIDAQPLSEEDTILRFQSKCHCIAGLGTRKDNRLFRPTSREFHSWISANMPRERKHSSFLIPPLHFINRLYPGLRHTILRVYFGVVDVGGSQLARLESGFVLAFSH